MGLGPAWVRRLLPATTLPAEAAESADVRAARIAALDWSELPSVVATCTACELCATRRRTVFGIGVERPGCLVIGEAPGADEDAVGEPFVGQAGKLLDAMLAAIGFSRDTNAFLANVIKCRPPGDRDPSPGEIDACRPFLARQIDALAPPMILVVGEIASMALLQTDESLASLRGREHRVTIGGREIPVVATDHPAYLLRSPHEKAKSWADLCLARTVHDRVIAEGAGPTTIQ